MTPAQDPKQKKIPKNEKVNHQKLVIFEGFSKNGYHHVFPRIFLRRSHRSKLILVRFLNNFKNRP